MSSLSLMPFWISLVVSVYPQKTAKAASEPSIVEEFTGHHPFYMCRITNAWLNTSDGAFYYSATNVADVKGSYCGSKNQIWNIHPSEEVPECKRVYKLGYSFTVFYWLGGSNYYHMHYDVLIPMYQALYYNAKRDMLDSDTILMPVVEGGRLQLMDWDTRAFVEMDKWWNQLVKTIATGAELMPLDAKVRETHENICFSEVYIGSESYKKTDSEMILGFVKFIKKQLGIEERPVTKNRLGIIQRKNRRRILNEEALVEAVEDLVPADLIEFTGMSFKQQVSTMQNYTIMVGMNGAGLMNCLYLPPVGVTVQLAPLRSTFNIDQFSQLLKNRGPYLEWYNTHEENHHGNSHQPDTTVHPGEFRELVKKALSMVQLAGREEL